MKTTFDISAQTEEDNSMLSKENNKKKSQFPNFLILLFFVEMWERFSYYGMRALLVLFLTSHVGFDDKHAYLIYSLFAAIGYAFPLIGGILADRLMGFTNMVFIGGIVITLGHIAMTFSLASSYMIFLGLALIAIGTGLFKGNITNLLGSSYEDHDTRRSQGFTLFYIGVNIGGFLSPIACAYVAKIYGWHYGFGIAGIGMILGLSIFIKFRHILGKNGFSPRPDLMKTKILGMNLFIFILITSIAIAFVFTEGLINAETATNAISGLWNKIFTKQVNHFLKYLSIIMLASYFYLLYKTKAKIFHNINIVAIMIVMLMCFFAIEMQLASLINLFTERNVSKDFLGLEIPAALSQSINPIVIVFLGFIFSIISSKKNFDVLKMFFSIVAMSICFFVLYYGCLTPNDQAQISYLYLFLGIGLMSLGEILLAPTVQAYVTLLSPKKFQGLIMGIMMLSLAFSNLAGIVISDFMSIPSFEGHVDNFVSLEIYRAGFKKIAIFYLYIALGFIPFGIYIHNILKKKKNPDTPVVIEP